MRLGRISPPTIFQWRQRPRKYFCVNSPLDPQKETPACFALCPLAGSVPSRPMGGRAIAEHLFGTGMANLSKSAARSPIAETWCHLAHLADPVCCCSGAGMVDIPPPLLQPARQPARSPRWRRFRQISRTDRVRFQSTGCLIRRLRSSRLSSAGVFWSHRRFER